MSVTGYPYCNILKTVDQFKKDVRAFLTCVVRACLGNLLALPVSADVAMKVF